MFALTLKLPSCLVILFFFYQHVSASPANTISKRGKLIGSNENLRCVPNQLPSLSGLSSMANHIARSFTTKTQLCGNEGLNGLPYDVGCTCPTTSLPGNVPFGRRPSCLLGFRTVNTGQTFSQRRAGNEIYTKFANMCRRDCMCLQPGTSEIDTDEDSAESVSTDFEMAAYSVSSGGHSRPGSASTTDSDTSFYSLVDYDLGICGATCQTRKDCLVQIPRGERGCGVCRVENGPPLGQSVVMGVSNIVYRAASCVLAGAVLKHSRPNGRRDLTPDLGEEALCPCNSTYVSQKCCEADDGLVWESHELKRGVLWTGDESPG